MDAIAGMIGEKVGDVVEETVKKVMGGKKEGDEKAEGGDDKKGGFDAGDVLSLVSGGNKDDKGGPGLSDVMGMFK